MIEIRHALPEEYEKLGQLMVQVYSQLDGFPTPEDQPQYYELLANIGEQTQKPDTELIVAVGENETLLGGVVYFSDMAQYGSGGTATEEKNASGFRLLAVSPEARGLGVAKKLTHACLDKAKAAGHTYMVIHTTKAMQVAWAMYEKIGFKRAEDLDFMQGELPVFGFRFTL